MLKLFNNDASDSDVEIETNNDYATKYNTWREKEELNKLKNKYGDHATLNLQISDDDSSSSEDDEDGKHLTGEFEKDFFKTLAYLKRKDPKIYDEKVVFFEKKLGENETSQDPKNKSKKPMFMKDYERKMILEKGAKFEDSDEEELDEDPRARSPTYVEEQRRIKESLKKVVDDEDNDEEKWGGLFQKRQKTKEEQDKEEEDYKKWLKGNQDHLENKEMEAELKSLKEYWNNPDLDKSEGFLRDYLLNKRYLDREDENHIPTYEEIIHDSDENLSEDEKNIDKQEEFEQKYNFRYEEPDQDFIKRYPRTMDHSVRKTDDRRKVKREEIKQRKEEEKKQKHEDLKQLKVLKRREIEEKIKKIKEITGNEQLAFQEMDIDGDFDPEEHDKRMQELFNDQYYGGDEGDQKPEFSDFEEELGPWKDHNELHCEDDDFNMDCDYDPSTSKQEKKEKKKRNRPGKSSKNTNEDNNLPIDENDERYSEYVDELYKLDYEDMIGDIPCRFKYRDVVANDFGLSVEEILLAKDKELNRWCSLKKTTQYRPEQAERYDVIAYQKKAANEGLKMKYLPSLFNEELDEELNRSEDNKNSNTAFNCALVNSVTEAAKKQKNKNLEATEETIVVEKLKDSKKSKKKNINTCNKRMEDEQNYENENIENTKTDNVELNEKPKKKTKHSDPENNVNKDSTTQEITENSNSKISKKKKKRNNNSISENENVETEVSDLNESKKLTRRQKKNKKLLSKPKPSTMTDNIPEQSTSKENRKRKLSEQNVEQSVNKHPNKKQKLNKKNKKFKNKNKIEKTTNISDSRLEAYGINPKKFKNKLKYKNK